MRLFFFLTKSFVIMDGPDPFSSSRRPGQRETRGDGRGARQGPDAVDMEETGSDGAHDVRWVAACGVR